MCMIRVCKLQFSDSETSLAVVNGATMYEYVTVSCHRNLRLWLYPNYFTVVPWYFSSSCLPTQLTPPSPLRISWRWWGGWRVGGRTWVATCVVEVYWEECDPLRCRKSSASTRVTIRGWRPSSSTMWNTAPSALGRMYLVHWRGWTYPNWRRWSPPNMSEVCDRDDHWQVEGNFRYVSSWGSWTWFMCMCTMCWLYIPSSTGSYIIRGAFFLGDGKFKC